MSGRIVTKEEFEAMPPNVKGYLVYMLGEREDQPNIPRFYKPAEGEEIEYRMGQHEAALEAQEGDD